MSVMAVDQWVADLFRAIDRMDAATFVNAFTEDGTFRFGNGDPAVGRLQVEQSVSGFFSMLGGLSHQITGVWSGNWEGGEVRSVEAEVTYTRKDGTVTQALPATSTLRMEGTESRTTGPSWISRPCLPSRLENTSGTFRVLAQDFAARICAARCC